MENRTAVVPVRLTTEERTRLKQEAKAHSISMSEYVRRLTFKRSLPPQPAPEVNREAYQALSRIGNNLNQLVKAINEGRVKVVDQDLVPVLSKLRIELKELGMSALGMPSRRAGTPLKARDGDLCSETP